MKKLFTNGLSLTLFLVTFISFFIQASIAPRPVDQPMGTGVQLNIKFPKITDSIRIYNLLSNVDTPITQLMQTLLAKLYPTTDRNTINKIADDITQLLSIAKRYEKDNDEDALDEYNLKALNLGLNYGTEWHKIINDRTFTIRQLGLEQQAIPEIVPRKQANPVPVIPRIRPIAPSEPPVQYTEWRPAARLGKVNLSLPTIQEAVQALHLIPQSQNFKGQVSSSKIKEALTKIYPKKNNDELNKIAIEMVTLFKIAKNYSEPGANLEALNKEFNQKCLELDNFCRGDNEWKGIIWSPETHFSQTVAIEKSPMPIAQPSGITPRTELSNYEKQAYDAFTIEQLDRESSRLTSELYNARQKYERTKDSMDAQIANLIQKKLDYILKKLNEPSPKQPSSLIPADEKAFYDKADKKTLEIQLDVLRKELAYAHQRYGRSRSQEDKEYFERAKERVGYVSSLLSQK